MLREKKREQERERMDRTVSRGANEACSVEFGWKLHDIYDLKMDRETAEQPDTLCFPKSHFKRNWT